MARDYRILVLGGYGHFGARICRALSQDAALIVAGRDARRAAQFAGSLGSAHQGLALDHGAPRLAARLRELRPDAVIHTCGPFQGQDYHVAEACVAAGIHYIDLADGRAFVAGIAALDAAARANGVLITSGASTLPALSAAVVDEHRDYFSRLDGIDISVAPGQHTPRGMATLEAVLSYCGKPFTVWEDGRWQIAHGWHGLRRYEYRDIGSRWLARCDVPDLELFPQRYAGVQRVRFDAALELVLGQFAFWLIGALVRCGLLGDARRLARVMHAAADYFDWMGSDAGGMHVGMSGLDTHGRAARVDWQLVAWRGHGPEIPALPAIVLARKLAAGTLVARGAMPCMGLMTLADFRSAVDAARFDIVWHTRFP